MRLTKKNFERPQIMKKTLSLFGILLLAATFSACSKKATTTTDSGGGGGGTVTSIEGSWSKCATIDVGGGTFLDVRFTAVISDGILGYFQQLYTSNDTSCSGTAVISQTRAGPITSGSGTPAVDGAIAVDIEFITSTVAAQDNSGLNYGHRMLR